MRNLLLVVLAALPLVPVALFASSRLSLSIPHPGAVTAGNAGFVAGEVVLPVLFIFENKDLEAFEGSEVRSHQARFVRGPFREIELDTQQ